MIALTWQTMLILAIAYFAGCIVGCFGRKLVDAHPGVPAAIPVGADAAQWGEVSRTDVAARTVAVPSAPLAVRPSVRSAQNAFRRADRDTPSDETASPSEATSPPSMPPAAPRATTPPPAPIAPPISVAAVIAAAHATVQALATSRDDLTRIRAIDQPLEAQLNHLGISRYAEIAAWTSERVKSLSQELEFNGRIEHENWIEQAQILARGELTSYASTLNPTAIPGSNSPPVSAPTTARERSPDVSMRAAFAEPRREAPIPDATPAALLSVGGRDMLQRIGGIGIEIEKLLNDQGVTRFSQVAGWSSAEVARIEQLLGTDGRIARENWIEQAQILSRGGATAYSREFDRRAVPTVPTTPVAPAAEASQPAPASANLSGMRSVRSEAFRGSDSLPAKPAAGVPDDLKYIRGIGILIETRLNAMGVTSYEQIANWTAEDVATVAHKLDFKGRIERENWIEQARILASGGQTDFSRRFQRGEV